LGASKAKRQKLQLPKGLAPVAWIWDAASIMNPDQLLELAHRSLQLYHLAPATNLRMINLSENATFKLECDDGLMFALRIHREGYHTREAIASELAWLIDLRAKNVAITPVPVAGRDGELIQKMDRHIVLFRWEAGLEPSITGDLARPFEILGETAARMHLHAKEWQRHLWFTRHVWNFETALGEQNPHWGRWREGLGVDSAMADMFARTVALIGRRLAAYGKTRDNFGLVHADMRLANLLIDGEQVKVLDFDDSGFSWFMYDAATTVSFYEHEPQVPDLIESWKQGYRRFTELSVHDEKEIQTFLMLRRLLLVAWIGTRRETDLAKSMGVSYSQSTVGLCEDYLTRFDSSAS
jgi:Ser/Thr protein kinase RdoA (MazF antagonist)